MNGIYLYFVNKHLSSWTLLNFKWRHGEENSHAQKKVHTNQHGFSLTPYHTIPTLNDPKEEGF